MYKNALGRRIINARNDRGLTQDQLCELCGISCTHLRKLEGGERGASIEVLIALCNALNISPAYLSQDSLTIEHVDMYDQFKADLLNASPKQAEYTISIIELMKKHTI